MSDVISRSLPPASKLRKPSDRVQITTMVVTPDEAEAWLSRNANNRPFQQNTVNRYARDLANGRWKFTGDAIRFDVDGQILDGQHRLMACVRAKTPFETLVIDGLPPDVRDFVDMGFKRTTSNALHFHGYTNTAALAAAAQWMIRFKLGTTRRMGSGRATTPEIVELVKRHPKLQHSAQLVYGQDSRKKFVLGPIPSLAIALHYVGAVLLDDEKTADAFLDVFQTGKPAYEGDPAHLWRERMIRYRTTGISVGQYQHYCGLVHAWNMFRNKEPSGNFKIPNEVKIKGLDVELI